MTYLAIPNAPITTDDLQWLLIGSTLALIVVVLIGVTYLVIREIERARHDTKMDLREKKLKAVRIKNGTADDDRENGVVG